MILVLEIVLIALSICNIVVHGIGCHLLWCVLKNTDQSCYIIYVLHLSICQVLMNMLVLLMTGLKVARSSYVSINTFIDLVYLSGPWLVYFLLMCSITFDRLLEILLHLKYPNYWNELKAKSLMKVVWIAGGILTTFTCLYQKYADNDIRKIFFSYWYPPFHIFFIGLTVTTYIVIFKYFKRSRRLEPCPNSAQRERKNQMPVLSTWKIFLNSQFYICVLLIGTYVIFVVVADSIYLFYRYFRNQKIERFIEIICYLSYTVGSTSDAYIYIFIQASVRKLFWKKLRICQRTNNSFHEEPHAPLQ